MPATKFCFRQKLNEVMHEREYRIMQTSRCYIDFNEGKRQRMYYLILTKRGLEWIRIDAKRNEDGGQTLKAFLLARLAVSDLAAQYSRMLDKVVVEESFIPCNYREPELK